MTGPKKGFFLGAKAQHLGAHFKDLLNGITETVEVIVDEAVLLKAVAVQETHERKIA